MTSAKKSHIKSNLTCMLASLSFAVGFPALEILLNDWGVISVVLIRNLIAFIVVLLIWFLIEDYKKILQADWFKGFIIGALGFGLGSLLLVVTQFLTTTFVAALAAALMPLAAIALEIIFDKRQITINFSIGLTLVLIGSIIILGERVIDIKFNLGLFIGLLSVTFFAWGSRASVKHLPKMTTLGRTATTTFGMSGLCSLIYIASLYLNLGATNIPKIEIKHIQLFIIYAGFGLAISQILWIQGVKKLGIGIASFHLNLTPFYVMIILFIIGYDWMWFQAIGALIVITGISVTQIGPGKAPL